MPIKRVSESSLFPRIPIEDCNAAAPISRCLLTSRAVSQTCVAGLWVQPSLLAKASSHAAVATVGRLIRCTVLGSTPKRLAMHAHPHQYTLTLVQGGKDALLQLGKLFALILGPPKSRANSFCDHRPLKLGEHAHHLKHGFAGWCRGVPELEKRIQGGAERA